MGLFSKKEPYEYKVLEKYKIDIESTNRAFQENKTSKESWGGREYCELVAENNAYQFYGYRTYSDHSGGYILRREKRNPKNIVFFGENKIFNCVFHDYLFQVSSSGELGRFGITGRNINDGALVKFNWLSEKAVFVVINGYGRFYSQDSVKDLFVKDGKLIFKVSRQKSNDPHHEDTHPDKYDLDIAYDLVVEYVDGKYKATRFFPPIETPKAEEPEKPIPVAKQPSSDNKQSDAPTKQQSYGLGRNESKHISCAYEGRENDCPEKCEKCAIAIKTDGDMALAKEHLDEAIRLYKKAVFIEPKFAEAWVNLGNAYGMKSEYNNALVAFDKALSIDPVYGKALFGKAITLRNLGRIDEVAELTASILELYPNADEVKSFKDTLGPVVLSLDKAIERMTQRAYNILKENKLLAPGGKVISEKAILCQVDYSARVLRFCHKCFASSGLEKVYSESVLMAFYGSLCTTLFYYNDKCIRRSPAAAGAVVNGSSAVTAAAV